MRKILLASIAALGVTAAASAQTEDSNFALGGGYTHLDADGITLGAITVRGTYNYNKYFGAEVDVHYGTVDETIDFGVPIGDVSIDLDWAVAAFGVLRYPLDENGSNVFVRGGYGNFEVRGSNALANADVEQDGPAYGVGGEFSWDGVNGIRADYTRFDGDLDVDTVGISYFRRF